MRDCDQAAHRPAFIITIDTEGDNWWSKPRDVQTQNARYLPRFQRLCERYGLMPVYLTDWEMVESSVYCEFAADVIARRTGEVGMHLHAWNTPPCVPLTADDYEYHPYLIEYPEPVMREKIHVMTSRLEERFQVKMVSHRAGRFSFDRIYAHALLARGYRVDCSVTPHISWRTTFGDPSRSGGTDFSACSEYAYWVGASDITLPGTTPLLEVPVTITRNPRLPHAALSPDGQIHHTGLLGRALRHLYPRWLWLRPTGRNQSHLLSILDAAQADGRNYIEFMLHSSELMPGGSPTFPTPESIERLYRDLEVLFATAQQRFVGKTLRQYFDDFEAAGSIHAEKHTSRDTT
jgi:hypothetical protein